MKPVEIQVIMRSDKDGYLAHGVFNGKEMTVFKGSKVFLSEQDKLYRRRLKLRGLDEDGVLMQDMDFRSPTAASMFVAGRQSDGWQEWVTPEGFPLEAFRDMGAESGTVSAGRKARSGAAEPSKASAQDRSAAAAPEAAPAPIPTPVRLDREDAVPAVREAPRPRTVQGPVVDGHTAPAPAEDAAKVWKMLLCADVRLGAFSPESLDVRQSAQWREARKAKFADLLDRAVRNHAQYVALFGRLFGEDRVSESIIDALFESVREDGDIQVLALVDEPEYKRITYRSDIPENFHLVNTQADDVYGDDRIALKACNGTVEIQAGRYAALSVRENGQGQPVLSGMAEPCEIPVFEPTGFEDAQGVLCGDGLLEWTDDRWLRFTTRENKRYDYRTAELKILPEDDQQEILRKINSLARTIDVDTFLRVTVTGRSAFGLTINADALEKQLEGRIFFVEVYDNTVMDIDSESFENDISLRSEFVTLALQDDSLSESERSRVISLGWNALSGKEVPAE